MKKRIVIEAANLTIHPTKFNKSGIQEVIHQNVLGVARVRHLFPDFEIISLPSLPMQPLGSKGPIIGSFYKTPPDVLEEIEKSTGLPSKEVWGFDLKSIDYKLSDELSEKLLSEANYIHFQSLLSISPLIEKLFNQRSKPQVSFTVYDAVPMVVPEYCPETFPYWFENFLLEGINTHAERIVAISRHTALDILRFSDKFKVNDIRVIPLPFDFRELGNQSQSDDGSHLIPSHLRHCTYTLALGSIEPRKNLLALVDGFEQFMHLQKDKNHLLVLVGGTGWKNQSFYARIKNSPYSENILVTGYVPDEKLLPLFKRASALAMVSHYEGYGLSVAQAFSLGIPVITSLSSSLPEACMGQAIFVDPSSPLSIAGAIAKTIRDANITLKEKSELSNWTNYSKMMIENIVAPIEGKKWANA